jgi:small-conductance mechanosensitive channel
MTNPFELSYLTTASPVFGPLAWLFFALQIAGIVAGIYFAFVRRDPANALRRQLFRWVGYSLLVVCGLGLLFGGLRLANVGIFAQRFWFYLVLLIELGLAAYITYYARFKYRKKLSRTHTSRGKAPAAPTRRTTTQPTQSRASVSNGHALDDEAAQPAARGGRRESRQRRKRKNR